MLGYGPDVGPSPAISLQTFLTHNIYCLYRPVPAMTTEIGGHKVSETALDEFKRKDVELSVPEGAPRPVLVIVMVSLLSFEVDEADDSGSCFMVCLAALSQLSTDNAVESPLSDTTSPTRSPSPLLTATPSTLNPTLTKCQQAFR